MEIPESMRKRTLRLPFVAVCVGFLAGPVLWAQNDRESATFAGTRIGFVNTLEVLYGTHEGRGEIEQVEKFMNEKQEEFDRLTGDLQRLRDQLAAQRLTLNPQTRAEMERDIEEREVRLKRFQEDSQMQINRRRDELLGRMSDKIQRVISEYAQEHHFGVIFLRDQSQAYVAPTLDLTQEIIRIYNEKNPGTAASPQ